MQPSHYAHYRWGTRELCWNIQQIQQGQKCQYGMNRTSWLVYSFATVTMFLIGYTAVRNPVCNLKWFMWKFLHCQKNDRHMLHFMWLSRCQKLHFLNLCTTMHLHVRWYLFEGTGVKFFFESCIIEKI